MTKIHAFLWHVPNLAKYLTHIWTLNSYIISVGGWNLTSQYDNLNLKNVKGDGRVIVCHEAHSQKHILKSGLLTAETELMSSLVPKSLLALRQ